MLKKLLSVVLAAILCLSLVACGGKTNRFAFSNSRNSKSHKDNLLNIP